MPSTQPKPTTSAGDPAPKHAGGRPSTQGDHPDKICDWIAEGNSLARYCRDNNIGYCTVLGWLNRNPEFAANYTSAREAAGDADADVVSDIRDRVLSGEIAPDVARVAIDAAKWTAGVRKPKKYGAKLDVEATVQGAIKIVIGGDL